SAGLVVVRATAAPVEREYMLHGGVAVAELPEHGARGRERPVPRRLRLIPLRASHHDQPRIVRLPNFPRRRIDVLPLHRRRPHRRASLLVMQIRYTITVVMSTPLMVMLTLRRACGTSDVAHCIVARRGEGAGPKW